MQLYFVLTWVQKMFGRRKRICFLPFVQKLFSVKYWSGAQQTNKREKVWYSRLPADERYAHNGTSKDDKEVSEFANAHWPISITVSWPISLEDMKIEELTNVMHNRDQFQTNVVNQNQDNLAYNWFPVSNARPNAFFPLRSIHWLCPCFFRHRRTVRTASSSRWWRSPTTWRSMYVASRQRQG